MFNFVAKFLVRRNPVERTRLVSTWDPDAVPSAPILNVSRPHTSPRQVHWWNGETACTTGVLAPSPRTQLPSCGFFPPSASYHSIPSDNLPWSVAAGKNSEWPSTSTSPEPTIYDRVIPRGRHTLRRTLSGKKPLVRVMTINRVTGEFIRRRRNPQKNIDWDSLKHGLGLVIEDCTTNGAPDRKIETHRLKRGLELAHKVETHSLKGGLGVIIEDSVGEMDKLEAIRNVKDSDKFEAIQKTPGGTLKTVPWIDDIEGLL